MQMMLRSLIITSEADLRCVAMDYPQYIPVSF